MSSSHSSGSASSQSTSVAAGPWLHLHWQPDQPGSETPGGCDGDRAAHDGTVEQLSAMTRPVGAVGHRPHLNPKDPNEFLATDTWNNLEGLQKFMSDPQVAEAFGALFGWDVGYQCLG